MRSGTGVCSAGLRVVTTGATGQAASAALPRPARKARRSSSTPPQPASAAINTADRYLALILAAWREILRPVHRRLKQVFSRGQPWNFTDVALGSSAGLRCRRAEEEAVQ